MNRPRKTEEEKAVILKRVIEARAKGELLHAACKANGITDHTFYNWSNKMQKQGAAPKKRSFIQPELVALPQQPAFAGRTMLVMGSPQDIADLMRRLQ